MSSFFLSYQQQILLITKIGGLVVGHSFLFNESSVFLHVFFKGGSEPTFGLYANDLEFVFLIIIHPKKKSKYLIIYNYSISKANH